MQNITVAGALQKILVKNFELIIVLPGNTASDTTRLPRGLLYILIFHAN